MHGFKSVLIAAILVTVGLFAIPPSSPVKADEGTRIIVLGGTAAVSSSVMSELAACTTGPVVRISGANRYATAAAVSASLLQPGVDVAYVATGENFPDALAGSAAAGAGKGGPVLLVREDSVPQETAAELQRLHPKKIVVLGGTAAVSAGVESALRKYGEVVRVAGSNRYSTGALVSSYAFPTGATTAFVATGANFPDALAGGPPAVGLQGPVLLVNHDEVPASVSTEMKRLHLSTIKVLGGSAAVSTAVEQELREYAPTVVRLSGTNRYATAAAVSQHSFAPGVATIFVATGTNFPDALAGGPVAGILGGPILLVTPDSVPEQTRAEIERLTGIDCHPPVPPETFGDGIWIVGPEIKPGTYRTEASPDMCYGARLSGFGGTFDEIIANEIGYESLIVTIEASDAGFESDDCDLWSTDLSPRTISPVAGFGDGYWQVGSEVSPGLWRNSDSSEGCYWERLSGFSWRFYDLISNGYSDSIQTVRIAATDVGFHADDCGTWTYLGP